MEKLRNMRALQLDNVEDLEKFTAVLENTVVMLQNQGYVHELQPNNTLYTVMLEKIPEELLSRYYRWIVERYKSETLETLKDWILEETEYRVKAAEAIKGLKLNKKKFSTHLGLNKRLGHSKGHLSCSYCKNHSLTQPLRAEWHIRPQQE